MPQVVHEDLQRVAADASLSLGARALILYALTREPGYRLTVRDLAATSNASDKAIYPRIKELMAAGYVTGRRIQSGYEYSIHPTPIAKAAPATSCEGA